MIIKLFNRSLQTKILVLVIAMILSITLILSSIFAYMDAQIIMENSRKIGLQTAKTISYMQSVQDAIDTANPSLTLQPTAMRIQDQVDANFIVIEDRNGKILTHPDTNQIGKVNPINDNYKAIVFGGYYVIQSDEHVGNAIVGKAPIINDNKQIIGVVTVGFLYEEIMLSIVNRIKMILYFALGAILIGIIASIFLARNIRKDTLGLEPRQIASLYRDQDAILSSINEGLIAIDTSNKITLINQTAKMLLDITGDYVNQPIHYAIPNLSVVELIKNKSANPIVELVVNSRDIILTMVSIKEGNKEVGTVITFRDKTEMKTMINTLSEVKRYSEDLRAQAHEFTNKLYAISGLLQLGYSDEAIEMIQNEMDVTENNNRLVFEQIKDPKVQGIILGKIGKASEKKISFQIDENSSLEILPEHIETGQLTTIIGNLIDNALEEVGKQKGEKQVSFFALDLGQDIIFEVTDNGSGINYKNINLIFKKGFSTKQKDGRGYGLANVSEVVHDLGGTIEVNSGENGTTFTVYIPKIDRGEEISHDKCINR
ncbi:sensor histidine kinase [Sutcliffiella cohnii]|uniref:sensor histidine kinase n=1 Tax=Sutcliffiella cohnii TaxID=33932 RepID=UPI002E209F57|nr:sensor histidine kinase [Sutcliffiella cohnii]